MRFLVSLFVVLSVAAFHSALSASLESAEKEEEVTNHDGLTWADDQLQEKDEEFEAALEEKPAQKNVTEDQNEDSHESSEDGSVEQHDDDDGESKAEGAAYSDGAAQESDSNSSEETYDTGTESRLDFSEQSTQNQDA